MVGTRRAASRLHLGSPLGSSLSRLSLPSPPTGSTMGSQVLARAPALFAGIGVGAVCPSPLHTVKDNACHRLYCPRVCSLALPCEPVSCPATGRLACRCQGISSGSTECTAPPRPRLARPSSGRPPVPVCLLGVLLPPRSFLPVLIWKRGQSFKRPFRTCSAVGQARCLTGSARRSSPSPLLLPRRTELARLVLLPAL